MVSERERQDLPLPSIILLKSRPKIETCGDLSGTDAPGRKQLAEQVVVFESLAWGKR